MSADLTLYLNSPTTDEQVEVFHGNITYNLGPMYTDAGWDFHDLDGKKASEIHRAAALTLRNLQACPEKYRAMNPANGWGDYEGCVEFFEDLVAKCEAWPDAVVHTWL